MTALDAAAEEFCNRHRWAVLSVLRKSGAPVSSVVAYAREGSEFIVSTPGATFKRRAIEADPRVNLCVISNQEPFNFVALEGRARIDTQNLAAPTRRVFEAIADTGYEPPADLDAWLREQHRVILRLSVDRYACVLR